ncbi:MAG: guanylate kinase [Bdellovibrionaceae bacterium]|nr:guanylate kinase [Pseudobdellovibrionaceae bacterium]
MTDKIVVVAAPSGAGKNTFIDKALEIFPNLKDVITYTTREMRTGEREGCPYHFVTEAKFKELIAQEFFVEWAPVHVYYYGTPWDQIRDNWKKGNGVIMDLDVQGAETFRNKFPQCLSLFIEPPSIDVLKERIIKREGKLPTDIDVRMQSAEKEMARAHEFTHRIVNDDFEVAFEQFKTILDSYLNG